MKTLESILTKDEANFVRFVFNNPSCKVEDIVVYDENGTPLWDKLEKLGLIKCVGSWKWKPTDKLDIGVLGAETVEKLA